jgi:hypothetical protein
MAYPATVIPVMIASPGDVLTERDIACDVINNWNAINSITTSCVLTPVRWETHSAAELGDRPQQLINDRILNDCDLLIGIFWTRLGTPTGKAKSGTVEEIENHLAAKKPVMLYFSSAPVVLDSVDPEQYRSLKEFKEWAQSRGLVWSYDDIQDFRNKLTHQLHIQLNSHPYLISLLKAAQPTPLPIALGSPPAAPKLTEEALELVREMAKDPNGTLLKMQHMGGTVIQTNRRTFGDGNDRRSIARWEHAIGLLLRERLIEDRANKGQIFQLTSPGYELADKLNAV